MAKTKKSEETPEITEATESTPSERTIITITVNHGAKNFNHTFEIESDDEIEAKLRKVSRRVKWWGGFLVRVLVNNEKASGKLVDVIKKVLSK